MVSCFVVSAGHDFDRSSRSWGASFWDAVIADSSMG